MADARKKHRGCLTTVSDTDKAIKEAKEIIRYCYSEVKPSKRKEKAPSETEIRKEVKKEIDRNPHHEHDEHTFKLFNDPIHGSIQLNSLENAIINTPEYFRLKNIKQLGATHHVYPGATHARFEHSIGVCYIAGEFVKHLNSKHPISKEDGYCIRLAALCHDLGHGPFSHAFTEIAKKMIEIDNKKIRHHEDLSKLIFKKILLDHPVVLKLFVGFGLQKEHVIKIEKMINPSRTIIDTEQFLYEIVANKTSGGVDVDKWDYFARDCHYLGVTNEFDWRRCMALSSIVIDDQENKHIGFRFKEMNNILSMFRVRCALHQRAYQHQAKNGIELMIKQALIEVKDVKLIYTPDGYKSMEEIVESCLRKKSDPPTDLSGYLCLNDTILDHILLFGIDTAKLKNKKKEEKKKETDSQLTKAKDIIERIMNRDLYALVAEESFPFPIKFEDDNPLKLEDRDHIELIMKNYLFDGEHFPNPTKFGSLELKKDDLELDLVSIKMASEENPNPIEDIYFFTKPISADKYPHGERKGIEVISKVNLPTAFLEHRLRLYWKRKCRASSCSEEETIKQELKRRFDEWIRKNTDVKTLTSSYLLVLHK